MYSDEENQIHSDEENQIHSDEQNQIHSDEENQIHSDEQNQINSEHKNTQEKFQAGSLIKAVETNDVNKVNEILQDTSYPINETNDKKETPLLIATHKNHIEIAKRLIDAKADINKQDAIQDSAYLYAGAEGRTEILAYMLTHANPDQKVYNRFGGNALIPAAEKGHLDNVKLLLKDGEVDIDHQNNSQYTALIECVALNDGSKLYQEIVKELLAHDANTELRDAMNKTALDYAKELGYEEMIALLQNKK